MKSLLKDKMGMDFQEKRGPMEYTPKTRVEAARDSLIKAGKKMWQDGKFDGEELHGKRKTGNPISISEVEKIKIYLMITITEAIRENNWSQRVAAHHLGVNQPRISNLVNGQFSKFTIDMLLAIMCKLGFSISVDFQPRNGGNPINIAVNGCQL